MFIRTKTGIYEFTQGMKIENWCVNRVKTRQLIFDDNKTVLNFLGEFVSQSEDLSELCDEFVIDSKVNNAHYTMNWFDLCEELQEDRLYSTDEIYGAIWTDKGLIYVAKMNDGGVLCLI